MNFAPEGSGENPLSAKTGTPKGSQGPGACENSGVQPGSKADLQAGRMGGGASLLTTAASLLGTQVPSFVIVHTQCFFRIFPGLI